MNTTIKPVGRTLAEFQPLKSAEQILLDACRHGKEASISHGRPVAVSDNNTVRAAFLRFLALGGDDQAPVHEHGVQLFGAWIEGELDMKAVRVSSDFSIKACHFNIPPVFVGAKFSGRLDLSSCQVPGFNGDGLVCDGGLFLCLGFASKGEVRLLRAQISTDLTCFGAKFDGNGGRALSADGIVIKGSAFFDQGFSAMGLVGFPGASIGGDLVFYGAKLDGNGHFALMADGAVINGSVLLNNGFTASGAVRLPIARIGGNLDCLGAKLDGKGGEALSADGMHVEGAFFFRKLTTPVNEVSLASSYVGHLIDDASSWGEGLVLDGFVYNSFDGGAPTDAATRLAWLDKQRKTFSGLNGDSADFRPQPWRQLAKILREMGHAEDARQVAISFEHRLRKTNLIGQTPKHWGKLRSRIYRNFCRAGHWLFWIFTGYGYRPLRLLCWILGVWLLCAMLYWYAALASVFAPSNPLVFQNSAYEVCKQSYVESNPQGRAASAVQSTIQGAGNWYLCEKLPEEYSGFSPLAYSLDVILPLVDLQQEASWAPLIPTPKEAWYQELFAICDWKHFIRLVLWFEILFGWVSSLLLVAVISGLTKRREE